MKTEELKMIVDLLQSLGDSSANAFMWWLVSTTGVSVFESILTATVFLGIVYMITKAITNSIGLEAWAEQVRDTLGVGTPGLLVERERKEVLEQIRKLKSKE